MTEPTGYNPAFDDSSEIWKAIPGHNDRYEVSNKGRVRTYIRPRGGKRAEPKLMRFTSVTGYLRVGLYRNGQDHKYLVHRLVAEAFIGLCPEGAEINHKDGDKTNNHDWNLEYVTRSGNLLHLRDNLGNFAEQILTRKQAEEIIALLTDGKLKQHEIAAMYGVCRITIADIWSGRNWADLPRSYPLGIDYRIWRKMQREKTQ